MITVSETELRGYASEPDTIVTPCVCCGGTGMDPASDENQGGECPVCCREYDQPWWFDDDAREAFEQHHGELPF